MTEGLILDCLHESHERLCTAARVLSDADIRQPSRLPNWTRDMLLAHLAYGGEAQLHGIRAAAAGQTVDMYPGGEEQRDREIESGRDMAATELADAVTAVCRKLEAALQGLSSAAWDVPVKSRRGLVPVRVVMSQRWLDVEVHHVDLDVGYEPQDWPDALIDLFLPQLFELLPLLRHRPDADRSITGSWSFRRTDGEGTWYAIADGGPGTTGGDNAGGMCTIAGSGRDLLALVLGRRTSAEITVSGDLILADQLKQAFPGP